MNKRYFLILISFLFWTAAVKAQSKWKFGSQNYAGLLEGQSGSALQLHSVNGFRNKTWFAGLGTGIDYYFQRSVPLYVSVSKFLPPGKLPFYFSGDAGINIPWVRNDLYYIQDPGSFSSSLYWAGGLGYRLSRKKEEGFLLHFGYSFKHLIQRSTYTAPCLVPPCPEINERYDYRMRRLSVKLGWMF